MTGIGTNEGKIRLRFESSTATVLATDRLLFEYTSVADNTGITDIEVKVDAVLVNTGTDLPAQINGVEVKVDTVIVDTGTTIPDLITALENLSAAEVKAELVAVLSGDVTVEPASVPSSTAPITDKLGYLFAFAANKLTQTDSVQTVRDSGDTFDISSASVTSNGITTTRGKHT